MPARTHACVHQWRLNTDLAKVVRLHPNTGGCTQMSHMSDASETVSLMSTTGFYAPYRNGERRSVLSTVHLMETVRHGMPVHSCV
eukprot:XP_001693866.1 predicted protein [Chlamydomonas reinhardtii]